MKKDFLRLHDLIYLFFALLRYWKSPVSLRGWKGKRFSWRDIYDVGVKWRKLVSMWYPVVWLDLFPKNVVDSGLSNHILFSV